MYKKKTPLSTEKGFSPWLASGVALGIVFLVEYFFSFPSVFLHSDFLSTLRSSPIACTQEYAPVCGKDGETYANSCYAKASKTAVARSGPCDATVSSGEDAGVTIPVGIKPETGASPTTDILTTTGASLDLSALDTTKYRLYENTIFDYKLALPKYAYYQDSLSSDKKSHILAIDISASGSANADSALVRMIYQPAGAPEAYTAPKARISLSGGATIVLEYSEPLSEKGQDIADTVISSVISIK